MIQEFSNGRFNNGLEWFVFMLSFKFEGMEEQNLSYEEDADYLSFPRECKNLPTYLNTKEKWMETVLQSNCIHRWLYLME